MEPQFIVPILFFLMTVFVLGAVLYLYLRKEQDKLTSSNKYSAAEVEITKASGRSFKGLSVLMSSFKNNFANRMFGALLFIGTYIAAMILTLIILAVLYHPTLPLLMLLFFPVALFEFPLGLIALLTQQFDVFPNEVTLSIATMMVYLSILLLAIFANDKRFFTFLYLLFAVLLIMNIAGCSISAPIIMSRIN